MACGRTVSDMAPRRYDLAKTHFGRCPGTYRMARASLHLEVRTLRGAGLDARYIA